MVISAVMYPVFAFLFAVVFGRIGTIVMDNFFRKDEMSLEAGKVAQAASASKGIAVAKHG